MSIPKTNYTKFRNLFGGWQAVYNEKRAHGRRVKFYRVHSFPVTKAAIERIKLIAEELFGCTCIVSTIKWENTSTNRLFKRYSSVVIKTYEKKR